MSPDGVRQRLQQCRGFADPIRQVCAIQINAFPTEDLALAIQRQVIRVFVDPLPDRRCLHRREGAHAPAGPDLVAPAQSGVMAAMPEASNRSTNKRNAGARRGSHCSGRGRIPVPRSHLRQGGAVCRCTQHTLIRPGSVRLPRAECDPGLACALVCWQVHPEAGAAWQSSRRWRSRTSPRPVATVRRSRMRC